jgi:hypothetical protein
MAHLLHFHITSSCFLQKVWDSGEGGYKFRTPDLKKTKREGTPQKENLKPFGGFTLASSDDTIPFGTADNQV